MALTPEQARELQQMLLEIEKLSGALKKNIDTTSLQDLEKSAGAIKQLFNSLKKEWGEINEDISFAVSGFQKIIQEISNVNIGLKESNKAYTNLTSIASKIQAYQQGLSELSSKEIKNLKESTNVLIGYFDQLTPGTFEGRGDYDLEESSKYSNALRDIINFSKNY